MKFLVRLFAVLFIVVSLYQLSYRFFTSRHESKMRDKAELFVKRNYANATPDEKNALIEKKYDHLLDSTRDDKIMFGIKGWYTYAEAKEEELKLGLDLQGGMNVTMEVGVERSSSGT